jgi:hypothetical protein
MSVKHHYVALLSKKWCPECDMTQPTTEFGRSRAQQGVQAVQCAATAGGGPQPAFSDAA